MMTGPADRTAEMIERLERLAASLRAGYQVTAEVRYEHRPFPLLVVTGRATGRVLSGARHYWWYGHRPAEIGRVDAVDDAARVIAERLGAARR